MNPQIKTQLFGILLSITTAAGCIAYERLVKSSSYAFVGMMVSISYMPFWIADALLKRPTVAEHPRPVWALIVFLASGVTGPIWYWLTREKNVITGAVFEVKYIAILVVCALVAGERCVTVNTIIGAAFAMASIYFISK